MSENVSLRHRRPIDSGISIGGNSNNGDEVDADIAEESSENNDVFSKDTSNADTDGEKEDSNPSKKSGSIIAVKERLFATANLLLKGSKLIAATSAIWFIGYLGFSVLWVGIVVFVFLWRENRLQKRKVTSSVLENIAKDERKYFQTVKDIYKMSGKDLPSWVYFPDIEKAEWLNKVLEQLWPYITDFVKNIIIEKVEPSVRGSNPLLGGFSFSKVDLGDKSPRVAGVKVYGNAHTRRTEIVMDLQIIYESDSNIRLTVRGLSVGIKDLSIRGLLRVELRPLISQIPLVGAVSVAFVHQPHIDYNLTDLGNVFDLPGIDSLLRSAINDCVLSMLVLPEKYILKLCDDVDISRLLYPQPKGVVRIHIIEAKNLEEKDKKFLGIGGGSDPYVEVRVGRDHEFCTDIIHHNVNPVWNECFDATVMDIHTSTIEITLFDDDGALSKDDYLGSASIQMMSVYKDGVVDEWIPLSNVERGKIHVRIEWLELSDDPAYIQEAMEYAGKNDRNSALLSIYVDSAKDLPLKSYSTTSMPFDKIEGFTDGRYEPSPQVRLTIPGAIKALQTKVAENTNNPVWEENFQALIQNPRMDSLTFQIHDGEKDEEVLGSLQIHIKQILESSNMTLEEPFNLMNSGTNSKLSLRISTRLLIPRESLVSGVSSAMNGRAAFVIAKSNLSLGLLSKPAETDKDESVFTEKAEEAFETSGIDEGLASSLEISTSTPSDGSISSTGIGIDFVDKTLAYFIGNAPKSPSVASSSDQLDGRPGTATSNINNNSVVSGSDLGRLNISLNYSAKERKLFVDVNKAEKLVICDKDNNTSDPYVRIYLLPNKRSSMKRKTKVVKNSINPMFSERLEYDIQMDELGHHQLDISVKNKTGLLSYEKVLMGQVLIDLSKYNLLEKPVTDWFPLRMFAPQDE